jgi:precorrin-3B C17-methyltransferase
MMGRLAIIGLGPGSSALLTPAASAELAGAELLVGYRPYLEQVPAGLSSAARDPYELGEERLRALRAAQAACEGRRVALVSSGDAGVYGMAALALEELSGLPAGGGRPEVVVVPGVTAATAAAALLGAPLAVDFACLSLSDLLVPAAELEAKTRALAGTDIVLAIYNPASRTRRGPWEAAVRHLKACRPPSTPVAAVRRAFRAGQSIQLGELDQLHELPVDMETVVIVGSSRTRRVGDWLLTLRDRERPILPTPGRPFQEGAEVEQR